MLIRLIDALLWLLQAAFWTAAGAGKIADLERFAISVSAYQILPDALVDPFAWGVAAAEIAAGILIAVPRTRAAGCVLALGLLAAFTGAAANALVHGRFHECGCRLPFLQGTTVGPHLLFRNIVLAAWLGFLLYRSSRGRRQAPLGAIGAVLWEQRFRIGEVAVILGLLVSVLHQKGINAKLLRDAGVGPGGPFANRRSMEPGVRLDPFQGFPVTGGRDTLKVPFGPDAPERVLILFSSACDACAASAPAWNERHAREGGSVEFLGVSASDAASTRRFMEAHRISFPVVNVDPGTWVRFRTSVVPRILRVAPDGTVREVRDRF